MLSIISILFGALIGSFLNVCISRIPRKESIVTPGSHCPECQSPIRCYDNIPIVSYLLLRGKCRYCRKRISSQYPIVEGVTALLSLFVFVEFGPSLSYVYYFAFVAALVVMTVIDLYYQIIPDVISLPGIVLGVVGSLVVSEIALLNSLLGLLLGGGSLFAVATLYRWLFKREGMGGGDVKLLAMIGAFLGWQMVILTILLSSLIGSIVGIGVMIIKGKDFKYAIPFGPFLSLGAVIALFYGEGLIRWYLYLNR